MPSWLRSRRQTAEQQAHRPAPETGLYLAPPRQASERARWPKRWILAIAFVVIVAASLYLSRYGAAPEPLPLPTAGEIPLTTARSGTLEKTLRLSGVTTAEKDVALLAPRLLGRRGTGGRYSLTIQKLVTEGERVKRGQIVAEFDPQYMLNRLDNYQSLVERQEMQVNKLAANLKISRYAHEQRIRRALGSAEKAELDIETIPVRSAILAERFRLAAEEAEEYYQQLVYCNRNRLQ